MTTAVSVPLPPMPEAFHEAVKVILTNDKFKEIHYKNPEKQDEVVWKRGDGYIVVAQYIKLDYQQNQLVISGWVRSGSIIISFPERSLDGFYGFAVKDSTKKTIDKIVALAQQGQNLPNGQQAQ